MLGIDFAFESTVSECIVSPCTAALVACCTACGGSCFLWLCYWDIAPYSRLNFLFYGSRLFNHELILQIFQGKQFSICDWCDDLLVLSSLLRFGTHCL